MTENLRAILDKLGEIQGDFIDDSGKLPKVDNASFFTHVSENYREDVKTLHNLPWHFSDGKTEKLCEIDTERLKMILITCRNIHVIHSYVILDILQQRWSVGFSANFNYFSEN